MNDIAVLRFSAGYGDCWRVKRLLQNLIGFIVGILATRFLVVAIAAAALLGFGIGLAGNAALVAEYSTDQAALRSERLIAFMIIVGNLGFLLVAVALWNRAKGVKSLYFDIPPRAWVAGAAVAQMAGFLCGWWLFA